MKFCFITCVMCSCTLALYSSRLFNMFEVLSTAFSRISSTPFPLWIGFPSKGGGLILDGTNAQSGRYSSHEPPFAPKTTFPLARASRGGCSNPPPLLVRR